MWIGPRNLSSSKLSVKMRVMNAGEDEGEDRSESETCHSKRTMERDREKQE